MSIQGSVNSISDSIIRGTVDGIAISKDKAEKKAAEALEKVEAAEASERETMRQREAEYDKKVQDTVNRSTDKIMRENNDSYRLNGIDRNANLLTYADESRVAAAQLVDSKKSIMEATIARLADLKANQGSFETGFDYDVARRNVYNSGKSAIKAAGESYENKLRTFSETGKYTPKSNKNKNQKGAK